MAARVIGLDVGTNAVRAVEIELGDRPLICRMGQVGLPPGAVVDGEVSDVSAVAFALRRLWAETGFKGRAVRVGMSSARVIVRTLEMPRLSHDELMSTIRLQLDDYVPLPPDETVFDVRTMDGPEPTDQTQHLLLAATHQDAVQPLIMAIQDANLEVAAVDVIPAALALALTRPEPDQDESVDVVLSIGAGTVVVVAARGGEALFSRTLTNAGGRRTTERVASDLSINEVDAERYKRLGATEDPISAAVVLAAAPSIEELIDEVRASLVFYAEQPSSRPVRRLLVTGGGSLLPGLTSALGAEIGIDVVLADPFAHVRLGRTGFDPSDLPYLAPYMAAALGVALGATRPKDRRIDLTPSAKRRTRSASSRRVLVGFGAVVLVGAGGALYMNGRSAIADEQAKLASAQVQLIGLQAKIAALLPTKVDSTPTAAADEASPAEVVASVAESNIDWLAVVAAVKADSDPLGVITSSFQGALDPPAVAAVSVAVDPAATSNSTPISTPISTPAAAPVKPTLSPIGTLTLTATAPGLLAVADWLDTIAADPRFAEPWASGFTLTTQPDGSSLVQFGIQMVVTSANLVDRSSTAGVPA